MKATRTFGWRDWSPLHRRCSYGRKATRRAKAILVRRIVRDYVAAAIDRASPNLEQFVAGHLKCQDAVPLVFTDPGGAVGFEPTGWSASTDERGADPTSELTSVLSGSAEVVGAPGSQAGPLGDGTPVGAVWIGLAGVLSPALRPTGGRVLPCLLPPIHGQV